MTGQVSMQQGLHSLNLPCNLIDKQAHMACMQCTRLSDCTSIECAKHQLDTVMQRATLAALSGMMQSKEDCSTSEQASVWQAWMLHLPDITLGWFGCRQPLLLQLMLLCEVESLSQMHAGCSGDKKREPLLMLPAVLLEWLQIQRTLHSVICCCRPLLTFEAAKDAWC